mgnify:CR=1 FL=1
MTTITLNHRAAGEVVRRHLGDAIGNASKWHLATWCLEHPIGAYRLNADTLFKICEGKYNHPQGPSIYLVTLIAAAIYPTRGDLQRQLLGEYLRALGALPESREADFAFQAALLCRDAEELAAKAQRLVAAREHQNKKRDQVAPGAEAPADGDGTPMAENGNVLETETPE